MAKELRPTDELDCEVCARTILKGERVEPYVAPGGQRRLVCELCVARAEASGWIRESAHADLPASHGPEPRRGLVDRMRGWRPEGRGAAARSNGRGRADRVTGGDAFDEPEPPGEREPDEHARVLEEAPDVEGWEAPDEARAVDRALVEERPTVEAMPVDDDPSAEPLGPFRRLASPRRRPRHVRAVPTNAQVKVERALEVFNASQHRRTVAGLSRTLGPPWVSAAPEPESPSYVTIVVAWELSWYRYTVDLGDAQDPVSLAAKSHELEELDPEDRDWNGAVTPEGGLVAAVGS
ncbi:MAG: hypothetical protein ACR2ML_00550 [Solirubrobacteraceae bacterium]